MPPCSLFMHAMRCVVFWLFIPAGFAATAPADSVTGEVRRVTDDLGRIVELEGPAMRIISLAPHLTEMLFELGVGERVKGTVRYSDYPAAAQEIPRLGDAFSVSVESVLALRPDIVFAWHSGGANRALARLEALGVVIYFNESPGLLDISRGVRKIAYILGADQRGEALAGALEHRLAELRRERNAGSPRVFFQISDQNLYTVTDQHLIGQAINWCGGQNSFTEAAVPVPQVSLEAVLASKPDLVIMTRVPGTPPPEWASRWERYPWLQGRVRFIDPNLISRPGPRMLDGISQLCGFIAEQASATGA